MIRNQRQYLITKAQAARLNHALAELTRPSGEKRDVHPLLLKAEQDGVKSQLADLRAELKEYEKLRAGKYDVPALDSFAEFPLVLIRARIAAGLTQKELAERLGLKEQQIQKYESTEYASASLSRVREVAEALGVKLADDSVVQNAKMSLVSLIRRLKEVGIDRDFVLKRVLPAAISAQLRTRSTDNEAQLVYQVATHVGRVFGWTLRNILESRASRLDMKLAAARLKVPAHADGKRVDAYLIYAHYLALALLPTMKSHVQKAAPSDPYEARRAILSRYGELTLTNVLRFLWDSGILVLPLSDPGAFHGAYFREDFRNVVVLKQKTSSASRWMFDALHETYHTLQKPGEPNLTVVEHEDMPRETLSSEEEVTASQYAGAVLLGKKPQRLAELCLAKAGQDIRMLKSAVKSVAAAEEVSVDALANYMAFRLSLEGRNWWGAAENLQDRSSNPFLITKSVLLENIDLSKLNEPDLHLLQRALIE